MHKIVNSKYPSIKYLSMNPNITWNIVKANPEKNWNYFTLSQNPNITWKIVKANPNISWNYFRLSMNKFKKHKYYLYYYKNKPKFMSWLIKSQNKIINKQLKRKVESMLIND